MFRDVDNATRAKVALVRLIHQQLDEDGLGEWINPTIASCSTSTSTSTSLSNMAQENFHQKMKRIRMEKDQEVRYSLYLLCFFLNISLSTDEASSWKRRGQCGEDSQ